MKPADPGFCSPASIVPFLLAGLALIVTPAHAGNRNSDCGGRLQRHCCLTETSNNAACDSGLVTIFGSGPGFGEGFLGCSLGTCYSSTFPASCGGRNEAACTANQHYQACMSGLTASNGFCRHPDDLFPPGCGHENQRACTIFEHGDNCQSGLTEVPFPGGTCIRLDADGYPPSCGDPGERPCLITEKIPSCKGGILEQIELGGRCIPLSTGLDSLDADGYPPFCGDLDEEACRLDLQILLGIGPCKGTLVNAGGTCVARDAEGFPTTCGDLREPACTIDLQIFLGIGPCKGPYRDLAGTCDALDADGFPTACGDLREPACRIDLQIFLGIGPCKGALRDVAGTCDALDADGYPTSCGGTGEPGCDLITQIALGITSCKSCHVEIPGIGGICRAVGADRYPTTCGGCSQPVCDLTVQAQIFQGPCKPGLVSEAGLCKRLDAQGNTIGCTGLGEPGLDTTVPPTTTPPGTPIWGFADLHAHPVSNLAFGGMVIWGEPWSDGGIGAALPHCASGCGFEAVTPAGATIRPDSFPLPPGVTVHGLEGIADIFNQARGTGVTHPNAGYPEFSGWPRYNALTHQQMYYRWVERAFRGGLKLMVTHAVNNELLCRLVNRKKDASCNDMATVDRQIAALKDMERFIDDQNGGPGQGWFRIVRSGAEARQVIGAGRMAVVLGIEADSLFDCKAGGSCTDADVRRELARYHDLGVRHLFPIHFFDNGFGGSSVNEDLLNLGNKLIAGNFWDVYDCSSEGFEFRLSGVPAEPLAVLAKSVLETVTGQPFDVPFYPEQAHCNGRGLTPLGEKLIKLMMGRKMIIDVDHMSTIATDRALLLAEAQGYPVVSGHSGFIDVIRDDPDGLDPGLVERRKLGRHVRKIRDLGGLVAPILHQGGGGERQTDDPRIVNPCANSSKSWARAYLYAADVMKGGAFHEAVALGSDFNGGISPAGPRFGSGACDGAAHGDQGQGVIYPFAAHDGFSGTFSRSRTGEATFDYNTMGLAHAGLLPDFVEDLKRIGLSSEQLQPLFRSAEAYVAMWERAEAKNLFPPGTALSRSPAPAASGWERGDVILDLLAARHPDGWDVASVRYAADGPGAIPEVSVAGASARVVIAAEGTSLFRYRAADVAGNVEEEKTETVRIDRTPPIVGAVSIPPPNAGGWNSGDVTVIFSGEDPLSGVAACDAPAVLTADGIDQAASGTCRDVAGNESAPFSLGGIRIDRTPPVIAFAGRSPAANEDGWSNTDVTLAWSCADALSGPLAESIAVVLTGEGATLAATGECRDQADNAARDTRDGIRIDRTPPVIEIGSPAVGATLLVNEAVAARYRCDDALSGAASCEGPVPDGGILDTLATGEHAFTVSGADRAGNRGSVTRAYTVISLSEGLGQLAEAVRSFNLRQGIENSFDSKLQNARDALDAANAGLRQDAANKLDAFRSAVEAQRDKELTGAQVDQLLAMALRVRALL